MRTRLLIAVAAGALAASQASGADDEPAPIQLADASPAALGLPLNDVLAQVSRTWGYSFVFDSRATRNKTVAPLSLRAPPDIALEQSLKAADLALYKINATTFAIKAAAAPAPVGSLGVAADVAGAATVMDAIVVTATATAPLAAAGSTNLVEIDDDELSLINAVNPAEVIYELPQSFSTITPANTAFFGPVSGISLADLRGLGPIHTLVLLNGRRRTLTPGGNETIVGVDLNAIAEPFLARIEIVNAPGGARIGTEAVAGSVNFVTKKSVRGVELGATYGLSQRGDADETSVYAIAGTNLFDGRLDLTIGLNLTKQEGLVGADREETSTIWGFNFNGEFGPDLGGSLVGPEGSLTGAVLTNGEVARLPFSGSRVFLTGDGGIVPFKSPSQLYRAAPVQHYIVPVERALSYFTLSADVASGVELFAEGHFGATWNDSQLAPLPAGRFRGTHPLLGDGVAIDINHPTVPASVAQFYLDEIGPDVDQIILDRRFIELGPRDQTNERLYADMTAGLRFEPAAEMTAEIFYRFGRSQVRHTQYNLADRTKIGVALDGPLCAATPGCAPVDFFRSGGVSAEAAAFIKAAPVRRRVAITEHEIRARATANINDVLAEPIAASAEVDFRRSILGDESLSTHDRDVIGVFLNDSPGGALNVVDLAATVDAPLLRSGAIGDLDLFLAGRVSDSSAYGPASNFEAAVRFRPTDGIEFLAQVHLGRRAPNLIELYSDGPSLYSLFDDPCGLPPADLSPVMAANCFGGGRLSVSAGFMQTASLTYSGMTGNPGVDPEHVFSQVYGMTLTPTDLAPGIPGQMRFSANWLSYDLDDTIMPGDTLFDCYSSADLSSAACGADPKSGLPLIRRDPVSEQITFVGALMVNQGGYEWEGVDLDFDYALETPSLAPLDRLWISAQHTIALTAQTLSEDGTPTIDWIGLVSDPKHRSLISVGGEAGDVAVNFFLQRRGAVETVRDDIPEANIPAVTTVDMTARWQVRNEVFVTFAVENLTDRVAPIAAFSEFGNVYPQYYDIIGRRFSIGVKGRF